MLRFFDLLSQVIELLLRERRMSYGALKLEFNLDDEQLTDESGLQNGLAQLVDAEWLYQRSRVSQQRDMVL